MVNNNNNPSNEAVYGILSMTLFFLIWVCIRISCDVMFYMLLTTFLSFEYYDLIHFSFFFYVCIYVCICIVVKHILSSLDNSTRLDSTLQQAVNLRREAGEVCKYIVQIQMHMQMHINSLLHLTNYS